MDTPRKTPRTDAELREICEGNECFGYVRIDFARALEIETQELAEALRRLLAYCAATSPDPIESGEEGHARAVLAAHKAKQPK